MMKSFLSDKVYDVLVWIALVALDAVGVCYKAIAEIWHLPFGNEILGTCAALSLCLGILLGVSKAQYKKNTEIEIEKIGEEVQEELNGNQEADSHE